MMRARGERPRGSGRGRPRGTSRGRLGEAFGRMQALSGPSDGELVQGHVVPVIRGRRGRGSRPRRTRGRGRSAGQFGQEGGEQSIHNAVENMGEQEDKVLSSVRRGRALGRGGRFRGRGGRSRGTGRNFAGRAREAGDESGEQVISDHDDDMMEEADSLSRRKRRDRGGRPRTSGHGGRRIGAGRPKRSEQYFRPPDQEDTVDQPQQVQVVMKRRGRPPGSGRKRKLPRMNELIEPITISSALQDPGDSGVQETGSEDSNDQPVGPKVETDASHIRLEKVSEMGQPIEQEDEASAIEYEIDRRSSEEDSDESIVIDSEDYPMEYEDRTDVASTSHIPLEKVQEMSMIPEAECDEDIDTEYEVDPEQESDEALVAKMFRSFASGRLFSDLLSEVEDDASDGRKRGRVNRSKETRSDKIRKIQNIVHALEQNYNEILTFEFFNFNGSEAAEVDAKVRIVMFKGGVVHEIRTVFEGNLRSVKEIGVNIRTEMFRSENVFDAAFFVAQVSASYTINPRGRKGQEPVLIEEQYFGVKPMGRMQDGDFVFECVSSGVHVITKDHSCTKTLDFDVASTEDWIRNRSEIEDLWLRTKKLSRDSNTLFIAYEITDEHAQEDWELINEKRLQTAKCSAEGEIENPVLFNEKTSGKNLARTVYGRCPLTHSEYQDLQEHLKYLNEMICDLRFELTDVHTVLVSKSVEKPEIESHVFTGTRSAGPGPIPDSEQLFPIYQEDVPFRTGKRNQNTWVRHKTPNNWVQKEAEKRLKSLPNFPPDLLPLTRLVNNFFLEDEFQYVGTHGIRIGYNRLFTVKEKEILATPMGGVMAISLASNLLTQKVFTPEDFKKVFEHYTEIMIEKQKADGMCSSSDDEDFSDED